MSALTKHFQIHTMPLRPSQYSLLSSKQVIKAQNPLHRADIMFESAIQTLKYILLEWESLQTFSWHLHVFVPGLVLAPRLPQRFQKFWAYDLKQLHVIFRCSLSLQTPVHLTNAASIICSGRAPVLCQHAQPQKMAPVQWQRQAALLARLS